jgi:hypothetical protein
MRVPFPARIPLSYSSAFGVVLCIAQVLEGTPLLFSLCSFAFILIATVAFNVAGGFSRPSGSYIFFYAVLAVILGLTYKAFLGEPADSHLIVPQTTMLVYVVGISGMLVAAFLKKLILPARGLLEGTADRIDLKAASIGCIVVGLLIFFLTVVSLKTGVSAEERYAQNSGTVLSALSQVNQFLPLGLILGVTYTIRSSGGRRFLSPSVAFGTIAFMVLFGIVGTSKQGLFEPIACVMVAAGALRYRFSVGQVTVFLLGMVFALKIIVPYIQLGKSTVQGENYLETVENAFALLTDLNYTREQTEIASEIQAEDDDLSIHYFDSQEGIFDRLQMISIDDALIDITEQGHVFGLTPLLFDVYNLVPHFIWPDKPVVSLGNVYFHEIGVAHYSTEGEDDTTTGISFSPTADAFHMARWTGVTLVAPLLWFACFFVMDWVCGDTRRSPWGLLVVALCAHIAPEGMMNGPFYLMTVGTLTVTAVSYLAAYVLPHIGNLFPGRAVRTVAQDRATILAPVRPRPVSGAGDVR